jgi:hypothetical protein
VGSLPPAAARAHNEASLPTWYAHELKKELFADLDDDDQAAAPPRMRRAGSSALFDVNELTVRSEGAASRASDGPQPAHHHQQSAAAGGSKRGGLQSLQYGYQLHAGLRGSSGSLLRHVASDGNAHLVEYLRTLFGAF